MSTFERPSRRDFDDIALPRRPISASRSPKASRAGIGALARRLQAHRSERDAGPQRAAFAVSRATGARARVRAACRARATLRCIERGRARGACSQAAWLRRFAECGGVAAAGDRRQGRRVISRGTYDYERRLAQALVGRAGHEAGAASGFDARGARLPNAARAICCVISAAPKDDDSRLATCRGVMVACRGGSPSSAAARARARRRRSSACSPVCSTRSPICASRSQRPPAKPRNGCRKRCSSVPAICRRNWPRACRARRSRCIACSARRPGGRFRHHRDNPLPYDVIVIDEASMIDVAMAAHLLEAVAPQTRLVMLGDKDQLAAVEAGAVFAELSARPAFSEAGAADRCGAWPRAGAVVAALPARGGSRGPDDRPDTRRGVIDRPRLSADPTTSEGYDRLGRSC